MTYRTAKPCRRCGCPRRYVSTNRCPVCMSRYNRQQRSTPEYKAKAAAQKRAEWATATPEEKAEVIAQNLAYLRRPEVKARNVLYRRTNRYGMSADAQNAMLEQQGFRCACCGDPLKPGRLTHLDHDHGTMQVRGFVCLDCNLAIGHLKDSPLRAHKLAAYLELHAPKLALVSNCRASVPATMKTPRGARTPGA